MKAINIAILLPQQLQPAAKKLNSVLRSRSPTTGFDFDNTHLPHITLLQCFVEDSRLPVIIQEVGEILEEFKPLSLKIEEVDKGSNFSGNLLPGFSVAKNEQITDLQERLHSFMKVQALIPAPSSKSRKAHAFYCTESELKEDIDAEQAINDDSMRYVSTFLSEKSLENYTAHISCGAAPPDIVESVVQQFAKEWEKPAACDANTLVLAHLGNYCTCRKIIHTWELK